MLTPVEMEQIRELIRYEAVVHSGTSSTLTIAVAGLTALGGWFLARWRVKRLQMDLEASQKAAQEATRGKCPICNGPQGMVEVPLTDEPDPSC